MSEYTISLLTRVWHNDAINHMDNAISSNYIFGNNLYSRDKEFSIVWSSFKNQSVTIHIDCHQASMDGSRAHRVLYQVMSKNI